MVTLGKWQGDRYIQVNFAENIRQLKLLGSCPVTVIYGVTAACIYRAVIYRFDKNKVNLTKLMMAKGMINFEN